MPIPRHKGPTRNIPRILESHTEDFWDDVKDLRTEPSWFSNVLADALVILALRCAIDPEADRLETWEACVTAMQVGSALFASAQPTTGTFEYRIGHDLHTIRTGALPRAHAGNWLIAFWLAAVCRERKRMTELCQVPTTRMRQADGVFDRYIYDWVDALQAYWLGRPEFGDKLVAAVEGTDPAELRNAPRDGVLRIICPPMNLLTQPARGDQEKFNAGPANSLEWHKDCWTHDEDRSPDTRGVIALDPPAVSCLAVQAGFTVTVESEYLPEQLLEGAWVNEFPT